MLIFEVSPCSTYWQEFDIYYFNFVGGTYILFSYFLDGNLLFIVFFPLTLSLLLSTSLPTMTTLLSVSISPFFLFAKSLHPLTSPLP